MQYYKCKCGKSEAWSSMRVWDCQGCDECNTTFATHSDGHKERAPHEWRTLYDDHTGRPYRVCRRCNAKANIAPGPSFAELLAEVERLQLAMEERVAERDKYVSEYEEMLGQRDEMAERAARFAKVIDRLTAQRGEMERMLWATIAELEFASEAFYEDGHKSLAETMMATAAKARAALEHPAA